MTSLRQRSGCRMYCRSEENKIINNVQNEQFSCLQRSVPHAAAQRTARSKPSHGPAQKALERACGTRAHVCAAPTPCSPVHPHRLPSTAQCTHPPHVLPISFRPPCAACVPHVWCTHGVCVVVLLPARSSLPTRYEPSLCSRLRTTTRCEDGAHEISGAK